MASMNFTVDPQNYLGFKYKAHLQTMLGEALAGPSAYQAKRTKLVTEVRDNAVSDFYTSLMNAMTTGTSKDGSTKLAAGVTPCVPNQEAGALCLSFAKTMEQMCDEVIEKIMPASASAFAAKSDVAMSKAGLVGAVAATI